MTVSGVSPPLQQPKGAEPPIEPVVEVLNTSCPIDRPKRPLLHVHSQRLCSELTSPQVYRSDCDCSRMIPIPLWQEVPRGIDWPASNRRVIVEHDPQPVSVARIAQSIGRHVQMQWQGRLMAIPDPRSREPSRISVQRLSLTHHSSLPFFPAFKFLIINKDKKCNLAPTTISKAASAIT